MRHLLLVLALAALLPGTAAAGSDRAYPVRIITKLFRGCGNVVFSPAEIPVNMYKEAKRAQMDGGNQGQQSVGYATGFITGIGYTIARIGVGAFDVVSFPIPTSPIMRPGVPAGFWETLVEDDSRARYSYQEDY